MSIFSLVSENKLEKLKKFEIEDIKENFDHLCFISCIKSLEMVKFFVENKIIDVNRRFYNDNTMLHLYQNPKIVDFLIKAKADVNAENENGCTPLHYANEQTAKILLDAGAEKRKNIYGCYPMIFENKK